MTCIKLKINWDSGSEFIILDLKNNYKDNATIDTTQVMSSDQQTINYIAVCESHEGKVHSFKLRYSYENNTHLKDKVEQSSGGWWGTTTIDIDISKIPYETKVTWQDANGDQYNGKAAATVDSICLYDDIEYELVGRIKRSKQSKLRQELLATIQRCEISGESTHAVLEVAHVIDANKNGACDSHNSLLLRSDLHKLFDARLIVIDESGNVKLDDSVTSEQYRTELTNKIIDKKTFDRISNALSERVSE